MGSVLKTQIKTVSNGTIVQVSAIPATAANSKAKADGAQGEKEGKKGSKNAAVVGSAAAAGAVSSGTLTEAQ
jgi:hypothetical protein